MNFIYKICDHYALSVQSRIAIICRT